MSTVTATTTTSDPQRSLSLMMKGTAPTPDITPHCLPNVPLDIWFLILGELHPRHAWKARNVNQAWRTYVEDHLARVWFRDTCVEVKWAPFFRIYDSPAPSIRDPYPLRCQSSQYLTFVRPEIDPQRGRRANVVKRLFLHEEVTVSVALMGEVSQSIKLQLKILPTNAEPEEEETNLLPDAPVRAMFLSANGRRIKFDWKPLLERACRQTSWVQLVT